MVTNQPPNGTAIKPSNESVDFIDLADGNTYKWVKVRVYPNRPYDDAFIAPPFKPKTVLPSVPAVRAVPKMGIFKDERDGQTYKMVTLGKQTWMAQNLNFQTKEGALYYDNDARNGSVYGMLYNYRALNEACPKGWHVPTDAEWEYLEFNAGMNETDTSKDMFRGAVAINLLDSGATKLNILFGGEYGQGRFSDMGTSAYFWTISRETNPIITRIFKKGDSRIGKNRNGEAWRLSVRCVKDNI